MLKKYKYNFVAFLLCTIVILIAEALFWKAPWWCDAWDYWNRGEILMTSGFELSSIDGFRGYLYPVYLGGLNYLGGRVGYFVFNALVISMFFTIIIRKLWNREMEMKFQDTISTVGMVICFAVLFVGVIVYPLSDLFALMMSCTALMFLKITMETDKTYFRIICAIATGCFAYFAYNVRTIYLFSGIAMILMILFYNKCNLKIAQRLGCMCCGLIGMITAGIPQLIMNIKNLGEYSLKVPTNGLMLSQMLWGLKYQAYATYAPNIVDDSHPDMSSFYIDKMGTTILDHMGIETFSQWQDYFSVVIKHPISVVIIYVKHFVNYIFAGYPEIYIQRLSEPKMLLAMLGFTVLFLALIGCVTKSWYNNISIIEYIWVISIPALLIIPGAVEYRFSLPLYLIAICAIGLDMNWKKLWRSINHQKTIMLLYPLLLLLFCVIWTNMLSSEYVAPIILNC